MAGGGIRGIEDPVLLVEGAALAVTARACDLEASDLPGATAETKAANPAVNTALPAMIQPRARRTRSSAASRVRAERDWLWPGFIRKSLPMMSPLSQQTISRQ